jgi:carbon storage regulator
MLVLSRTCGEQIVIGDNVIVSVLSVRNGRVRIGIAAPPEVPILREEIRDGMKSREASFREPAFAH